MSEMQNNEKGKPITPEDIVNEMTSILAAHNPDEEGLFIIKTANKWLEQARNTPAPRMLFKELWHEGEVCILFADTNTGKSILAVQIGNEISEEHLVLYFDFEMSAKQFEVRYSDDPGHHFSFSDKLHRIELTTDVDMPEGWSFEEYLNACIERAIVKTGAKILIIDNLTYLRQETERAKDALPLMKELKALKNKHGLSILCLAHTPKRDMAKPITRNDLQGSKMLINFCDAAFAIGESAIDKDVRYIKQIKARNTEVIYDSDNVIIACIVKAGNFLRFEIMGCGAERDHLKQIGPEDREDLKTKVMELHQKGLSLRQIGNELGINHMTVSRMLKRM